MEKGIKVTLRMAAGVEAGTLQELRDEFDLISVLEHYSSGQLLKWLTDLHYEEEAGLVSATESSIDNFEATLCAIL